MERRYNEGFTQAQRDFIRKFTPGDIVYTMRSGSEIYATLQSGRVFADPGDTMAKVGSIMGDPEREGLWRISAINRKA